MLRLRLVAQIGFLAFALCAPLQQACAQQVDAQKISNLKSQQTSIENRIADLQAQVDDAYADNSYCSAEDRAEDLKKLRALQRQIAALRKEYGELKEGFIKLAATQTAGPQFDAAGIHPDEQRYWTADDNALRKLRESALAKADRVEQAPIRNCNEKKTAPTPAPAPPPPKAPQATGEQTGTSKPSPTTPRPRPPVAGPTAPLGGPLPSTGCTDRERTDRVLRIQEEILRVEEELIPIDGTTKEGRARQLQLMRELERLKRLMALDCPPLLPPIKQLGGTVAPLPQEILKVPTLKIGNQVPPNAPKPQPVEGFNEFSIDPLTRLALAALFAYADLDDAIYYCDWEGIEEQTAKLEDLARRARELAKMASAADNKARAEQAEELARRLETAAMASRFVQSCRQFRLVSPDFENAPAKPAEPEKPLPGTTAKPTLPAHSIVEDIREPPTPLELNAIEDRVRELGKLTRDYPNLIEGCQPQIWDKHIGHLEDLAKRARQIADDVKRGYSNGVDVRQAERIADEAGKEVDEAKREKAANQARWRMPQCPKKTSEPKQEPKPGTSQSAVPRTPAQELSAIEGSLAGLGIGLYMSGGKCDPETWRDAIVRLEEQAKRAQDIADAAKTAGAYSSIKPDDAQKRADSIRRTVDSLKANPPQGCPGGRAVQLNPFASRILTIHNAERAAVGAQPLRWNPALEASAAAYATQLAQIRDIVHAPREGRGIERENLLKALPGWSPDRMMQVWTSEKSDFVAGYFPNVARDGNWMNVAHYTQMIWPTTTDIGCGMAPGGGFNWLVCRYSPGGNKDNKPVGYGSEPRHPERG